MIIVDRGPWHPYTLSRLRLECIYQRFGRRNIVERFSGCLKLRTGDPTII
jgi:transposase-like protein